METPFSHILRLIVILLKICYYTDMKFDIKKLEKYYNRPSFNFLAYQGFLLSLNMSCCFMASLYLSIANHKTFEDVYSLLILCTILSLPYVIFYSFIAHSIYSSKKNKLFNLPHIIFNALLFFSCYYIFIRAEIDSLHSGGYGAMLLFACITGLFIPPTAILFTLLPYLVICYREKKHNLTIENPPFIKNKYLLYATLFGTALYILVNIVVLYITVTYFFEIKFFT